MIFSYIYYVVDNYLKNNETSLKTYYCFSFNFYMQLIVFMYLLPYGQIKLQIDISCDFNIERILIYSKLYQNTIRHVRKEAGKTLSVSLGACYCLFKRNKNSRNNSSNRETTANVPCTRNK